MMACLADHIVAAPFSIIGSVGVLAQVPNFNKILKKNDVDYYQVTAGKYKRTLTLMGEVTDEGLDKFKEDIEDTHKLFKNHIKNFRPKVDLDQIATGEHWYGANALELGLIDEIKTSDDFIVEWAEQEDVFAIQYKIKKPLADRLPMSVQSVLERTLVNLANRASHLRLFK